MTLAIEPCIQDRLPINWGNAIHSLSSGDGLHLEPVFDLLFDQDANVRRAADLLLKSLPTDCHSPTDSLGVNTKYSLDINTMITKLQTHAQDNLCMLVAWGHLLTLAPKSLHKHPATPHLLTLVQPNFNSLRLGQRVSAFIAWRSLCLNFSYGVGFLDTHKRINLILLPIWNCMRFEKSPVVRQTAFETLIYLVLLLNNSDTQIFAKFFRSIISPLLQLQSTEKKLLHDTVMCIGLSIIIIARILWPSVPGEILNHKDESKFNCKFLAAHENSHGIIKNMLSSQFQATIWSIEDFKIILKLLNNTIPTIIENSSVINDNFKAPEIATTETKSSALDNCCIIFKAICEYINYTWHVLTSSIAPQHTLSMPSPSDLKESVRLLISFMDFYIYQTNTTKAVIESLGAYWTILPRKMTAEAKYFGVGKVVEDLDAAFEKWIQVATNQNFRDIINNQLRVFKNLCQDKNDKVVVPCLTANIAKRSLDADVHNVEDKNASELSKRQKIDQPLIPLKSQTNFASMTISELFKAQKEAILLIQTISNEIMKRVPGTCEQANV